MIFGTYTAEFSLNLLTFYSDLIKNIITYLCVCDYRQDVNWILDLLTICLHHSELHSTLLFVHKEYT
jgi:hypothetical protein